ncbi:formate/nitrite transporter family protein [Aureimonas populi]|uniref:Formate/nitrite transporter family protein n=1 Tax=Aureimonas populi TaxID=1701758 RepID=A0ABW5CMF1_9HYPH|nr:formate/nitrite transporter family protein [Aureimonas populi]
MADEAELAVDDASPAQTARNTLDYLCGKVRKASSEVLVLSLLAGGYIAFGAIVFLVVGAGGEGFSGPGHLLAGLGFSVGLILVIVAGAELFTGDTLLVVNRIRGTLDAGTMWRFWTLVYFANFAGALVIAALFVVAGGHMAGEGAVGLNALEVGASKTGKSVVAILASGILANMLVCLAVWAAQAARTVPGKILAVIGPISAFVAAGFEHSVANMSLLPIALMVKGGAGPEFWAATGVSAADFPELTLGSAVLNLVVCTIGNTLGGASIGLAYWYAFLRKA